MCAPPLRSACITKNSINSAALNPNPQNKHMRMLVAGSVAVSSSGTTQIKATSDSIQNWALPFSVWVCVCLFAGYRILLSDTTLMPDIPGLPALVTMLFTPVMELRSVRHRLLPFMFWLFFVSPAFVFSALGSCIWCIMTCAIEMKSDYFSNAEHVESIQNRSPHLINISYYHLTC